MSEPYAGSVEAFFVIVTAAVVLAVGAVALVAVRRLLVFTDRRPGDD
jgi:hypothetical protein